MPCTNFYVRHWFIVFGTVGMRTPVCSRCGHPNPRRLTDGEWRDLIDWAGHNNVGDPVRTAVEEYVAGRQ